MINKPGIIAKIGGGAGSESGRVGNAKVKKYKTEWQWQRAEKGLALITAAQKTGGGEGKETAEVKVIEAESDTGLSRGTGTRSRDTSFRGEAGEDVH